MKWEVYLEGSHSDLAELSRSFAGKDPGLEAKGGRVLLVWSALDNLVDPEVRAKAEGVGIRAVQRPRQLVVEELNKPPKMGFPTLIIIDSNE